MLEVYVNMRREVMLRRAHAPISSLRTHSWGTPFVRARQWRSLGKKSQRIVPAELAVVVPLTTAGLGLVSYLMRRTTHETRVGRAKTELTPRRSRR